MALYLSGYKDNLIDYADYREGMCWASPPAYYPTLTVGNMINNKYLVTCPRHYSESINQIQGFFYVPPPRDMYVLWAWLQTTYYPGWAVKSWWINASTGAFISRQDMSFWNVTYINNVEIGDLGRAYATNGDTMDCIELSWETGARQGWRIKPYSWNPQRILKSLLVDRQGNKILSTTGNTLEIWKSVWNADGSITAYKDWAMRAPENISDLAYESNSYGWVITTGGKILKVDWGDYQRVEMFSSIQAYNPTDRGYFIAYDGMRKRIGVLRWIPDATDGACQLRLEFYETVPKPQYITQPVPITSYNVGDQSRFVSNMIGSMGEGFGGQPAEADLVAPGNHGTILSPNPTSGLNGNFMMNYKTPAVTATDTIRISAEYRDTITLAEDIEI